MTSHKHDSAPKCFYCGKIGHIAKFFHKEKADGERYKQRRHVLKMATRNAKNNIDINRILGTSVGHSNKE